MDFDEVIRRRHMTRKFRQEAVSDKIVEQILDVARRAPSAGHLQPYEFIVVKSKDQKLKLARAALDQMWIYEAPLVIVTCANTRRSASRYGRRGVEFYSIIDASFASLYILLKCTSLGLGSSFVGAFDDDEVSRILNLPVYVRPVGLISIGYKAEKGYRLSRIAREQLVHYEKW